jgi:hypothetical protein
MALAAPMYAVWRMRQRGKRKPSGNTPSVPEPSVDVITAPASDGEQTGLMRWISVHEFMTVLADCRDLIVIDIRADAQWVPFAIPNTFVLPVTPYELIKVLEWLPSDKTVVFYGASDLSIFMIHTSSLMKGSAPLYLLEGELSLAEVA